jgi:hypothetical protein
LTTFLVLRVEPRPFVCFVALGFELSTSRLLGRTPALLALVTFQMGSGVFAGASLEHDLYISPEHMISQHSSWDYRHAALCPAFYWLMGSYRLLAQADIEPSSS